MTHLPFDVTFVDENDTVRYYSEGKKRLFPRSPGIIGRRVQNCHPPASVHVVRYFAVRDASGRYRGVLEVSQDIAPIRALEGEQKLLQW